MRLTCASCWAARRASSVLRFFSSSSAFFFSARRFSASSSASAFCLRAFSSRLARSIAICASGTGSGLTTGGGVTTGGSGLITGGGSTTGGAAICGTAAQSSASIPSGSLACQRTPSASAATSARWTSTEKAKPGPPLPVERGMNASRDIARLVTSATAGPPQGGRPPPRGAGAKRRGGSISGPLLHGQADTLHTGFLQAVHHLDDGLVPHRLVGRDDDRGLRVA